MSGSLVTPELRARVRGLAEPVARGFGRLGLTPNHLTFIGFGIAIVAAVAAGRQAWLAAGLLVVFGGVFDLFDGALARSTGRVSKLGAFYDSVFDRWGEGVIYIGIAWACADAGFVLGALLATIAMTSAFMVSYVRAKSESLGYTPGTRMANVGLAPREVRIAILTIALLAVGVLGPVGPIAFTCPDLASCVAPDYYHAGDLAIASGLGLIAILATITTIQRILHVRGQAREG
ncbi:MAG TPA: CDP-alcohol phosphatidyltransferase family protein [Candidatus Limnocylindrales bacterium]|nr:CDP-alcohol phosphatidyltransferase family protein [Candidatus Limnocylindrales bacterium]